MARGVKVVFQGPIASNEALSPVAAATAITTAASLVVGGAAILITQAPMLTAVATVAATGALLQGTV